MNTTEFGAGLIVQESFRALLGNEIGLIVSIVLKIVLILAPFDS